MQMKTKLKSRQSLKSIRVLFGKGWNRQLVLRINFKFIRSLFKVPILSGFSLQLHRIISSRLLLLLLLIRRLKQVAINWGQKLNSPSFCRRFTKRVIVSSRKLYNRYRERTIMVSRITAAITTTTNKTSITSI